MTIIASIVLVAFLAVTLWSLRDGDKALGQFSAMFQMNPWGKQLFVDFYGLVAILALWICEDAATGGNWTLAIACIATMPVLGAGSAAAYWLLR